MAIALNYSIENIRNDVCQIIYPFDSLLGENPGCPLTVCVWKFCCTSKFLLKYKFFLQTDIVCCIVLPISRNAKGEGMNVKRSLVPRPHIAFCHLKNRLFVYVRGEPGNKGRWSLHEQCLQHVGWALLRPAIYTLRMLTCVHVCMRYFNVIPFLPLSFSPPSLPVSLV